MGGATLMVVALLLGSSLVVFFAFHPVPGGSSQALQFSGASAPAYFPSLGDSTLAYGQEVSANATTKGEIASYITSNPGVYLREIVRNLGLPMGVVQYHVWLLLKGGQIQDQRTGRYRRFFATSGCQQGELEVIGLLRQGTAGRILVLLSAGTSLGHSKIAAMLGVTSQALTWQMNRLGALGVVEKTVGGGHVSVTYHLTDGALQAVRGAAMPPPSPVAVLPR